MKFMKWFCLVTWPDLNFDLTRIIKTWYVDLHLKRCLRWFPVSYSCSYGKLDGQNLIAIYTFSKCTYLRCSALFNLNLKFRYQCILLYEDWFHIVRNTKHVYIVPKVYLFVSYHKLNCVSSTSYIYNVIFWQVFDIWYGHKKF